MEKKKKNQIDTDHVFITSRTCATSNNHMFFTSFSQSMMDTELKFETLAIFGLLKMMNRSYLKKGPHKSPEYRSNGQDFS